MDSKNEKQLGKIVKSLIKLDLFIIIAFVLIGALGIKSLTSTTKTTKALSEVAQKVGVDFPTKTNTLFGTWQVVRPL